MHGFRDQPYWVLTEKEEMADRQTHAQRKAGLEWTKALGETTQPVGSSACLFNRVNQRGGVMVCS